MFSLIIAFIIGLSISGASMAANLKSGTIAYGIIGFIVAQVLLSLVIRKKIKGVNEALQDEMTAGQKRLQHKIHQFQTRPGGNPTLMQRQLEQDQQELIQEALEFTKKLEPFKPWNVLMSKQIATMRLQFLYQLKEFEQVDEILAKGFFTGPIFSDPLLVAMKMARQFKNDTVQGAEKTFKRYIRWYRNDSGALLYGVMSWIYVKQKREDDARQLLAKAKEKMFHEVISRNWELLANNRTKNFSNAGFGDPWYTLHLENPPAPKRQKMRAPKRGHRPF